MTAQGSTKTARVELRVSDGTTMSCYVAQPGGAEAAPGLLVFQEAFGVNSHIRNLSDRFARQGFVAIAPELYHRTAPAGFEVSYSDFAAAAPHRMPMTSAAAELDVRAAFDWLQAQAFVKKGDVCSVGFCMGGRISFLANSVLPLRAAASFYGGGMPRGTRTGSADARAHASGVGRTRQTHSARTTPQRGGCFPRSRQELCECRVLRRRSRVLLRRTRRLQSRCSAAGLAAVAGVSGREVEASWHRGYCSAVIVTTISRSRGPSSSTRTTRCQVPSRRLPFSKGRATELPISEDIMWSGTCSGLWGWR